MAKRLVSAKNVLHFNEDKINTKIYLKYAVDSIDFLFWFFQGAAEGRHLGKYFENAQMLLITIGVIGADQFPCMQWKEFVTCILDEWR